MVLCWRRYGRAGGCRNPLKNKSKTLSYIKYHLQRCLYTLVFTSDPSSESFWSWMTDKSSVGRGKQSIPVETPRIAQRFLEVTCEASYMVPWKLNIENNLKYQYRACERSKDLKQRDRKMKGSNIPIIKNKRHPRPLSNINGKTKQFKNNQVCRATLCKTDQTRIARLFCRLSCKERREDALALRADERRDKLRKAAVRSKYPLTRRCLNGETRLSKPQSPYTEFIGIRREPGELKHLSSRRKRKKHRFPE